MREGQGLGRQVEGCGLIAAADALIGSDLAVGGCRSVFKPDQGCAAVAVDSGPKHGGVRGHLPGLAGGGGGRGVRGGRLILRGLVALIAGEFIADADGVIEVLPTPRQQRGRMPHARSGMC